MKQYYSVIALLFVCLLCNAQSVTHKLYPTDDTYIYSDNTIRGMEYTLKTYHSTAGSQYRRISYLKFDISTLSPHIQSVTLRLYCEGFSAGGSAAHEFDLYPVLLNTWAEDDVSFNNYVDKVGTDITTPLLASFTVAQGNALGAQYIELTGNALTQSVIDSINAGKKFISFRMREKNVVKNGSAAVIVDFDSKENPSGFAPELNIEEKDIEQLKASDIKIDNVTINGFSENTYRYVYQLPYNATVVPQVTATAKYPPATTVSLIQATSLSGTDDERTAKINLQNGADILTYYVDFQLLPPPTDARLASISIDGVPLENFAKDSDNYLVYLPYSISAIPVVTAIAYDPNASVDISQATGITSDKPAMERTAVLKATSANASVTKTYRITFEQLPPLDIILSIGQSNMSGRAPYIDVTAPMPNIYLLTPGGGMEMSSNPMNKYSNIRKDLSVQGLGPSYTCALKLQSTLSKPIGFAVNAQGGSSITAWYKAGKADYDATIIRARQAQRFGKIRAIIWHQGESDHTAATNDNFVTYKANLATMVQSFRNDLNEPDMYFVCGELSQLSDRLDFNANVIRTVASYIENADYIVTTGTSLLSDGIHFDEPSVKLIGERYADKLIEDLYSSTGTPYTANDAYLSVSLHERNLVLTGKDDHVTIDISDMTGRRVKIFETISGQTLSVPLQPGMYILKAWKNKNGQIRKIIIP
jgi:hypothetical protein